MREKEEMDRLSGRGTTHVMFEHLCAASAPHHKNQGSGAGRHVASLKKDFSKMTITPPMTEPFRRNCCGMVFDLLLNALREPFRVVF